MVSQRTTDGRETDRRKLLAGYLYDCSKMMYGSVAVGFLGGAAIAYAAYYIMRFKR